MIDIHTYKKLHPTSILNKLNLRADLDSREMTKDEPPQGRQLLVFPPEIPGYNMLRKEWGMQETSKKYTLLLC
jgi:hypothetical protein